MPILKIYISEINNIASCLKKLGKNSKLNPFQAEERK